MSIRRYLVLLDGWWFVVNTIRVVRIGRRCACGALAQILESTQSP
jgi:hypothetical protein